MLRTRVVTAFILAIVLFGALFRLLPFGWLLSTFAVICVAFWEWCRLAQFTEMVARVFLVTSILIGLGLLYLFSGSGADGVGSYVFSASTVIASVFWFLVVPPWLKYGWRPKNNWLLALTGWLVIFPTWFALIELRNDGPWVLLGLMALVWVADIAAYFAGRRFGRHKLAPSISPGKTWEGVAGAVCGVLIYAWACIQLAARFGGGPIEGLIHSWPTLVISCLVLAALSITGDLFESWMKRGAGIKDSSNLLPGHGGVLDRVDALTSTLPVAPLIFFVAKKLVNS